MIQLNTRTVNQIVVLVATILISSLFLSMIRQFLITILLAGIFAGLGIPLFNRLQRLFGDHKGLNAGLTITAYLVIVFLPLAGLLIIVASQAVSLSQTAIPLIRERFRTPGAFDSLLVNLPFYQDIEIYSDQILEKASEMLGSLGSGLFERLSTFTYAALFDIVLFFIFWYTMFFFLKDGESLMEKIRAYLPLSETDQRRLLDKFLSVTRATIRGTLVIGMVQGSLAGIAFSIAGIESAAFWGTVMALLSILPMIGPPIVWIPAVIMLAVSGQYLQAAGLALFCSIVVGQIDNILRPVLVGRDTQMHELFIFFGTLGGIGMFGVFGFIIGPVIAALFVTVWDIYGETFSESLVDIRKGWMDSADRERE
ncbi:MAG: AI-2E family transporter [Chlorobiaceae bacterium]|nr:AI-2E family transporter [Chlorobiaceae bacterium]